MSTTNDIPPLDSLRAVLRDSKEIWGHAWIDESAFFVATSRLKHSLASDALQSVASLSAIDDIEDYVEKGTGHFMGKVLVKRPEFAAKVMKLEQLLAQEKQAVRSRPATSPATAEEILAQARRDAEAIIAQAHEEAARIRAQQTPS